MRLCLMRLCLFQIYYFGNLFPKPSRAVRTLKLRQISLTGLATGFSACLLYNTFTGTTLALRMPLRRSFCLHNLHTREIRVFFQERRHRIG
jgi:hypothetical protein